MNNEMVETNNEIAEMIIETNEFIFKYAAGDFQFKAPTSEDELYVNYFRKQFLRCLKAAEKLYKLGIEDEIKSEVEKGLAKYLNNSIYTTKYTEEEFADRILDTIAEVLDQEKKLVDRFYLELFNTAVFWKENKTYTEEEKRALKNY